MSRRPKDWIRHQDQRRSHQNEETPTAEAAANGIAPKVIAYKSHNRVADRINQAGNRKNKTCLNSRYITGCRIEKHQKG